MEPLTLSINRTDTDFGFAKESPNQPPEAFMMGVEGSQPKQLSHFNGMPLYPLGQIHLLHWSSTDGTPIEGLFITPPHYNPNTLYPLYVDVHGGPSGTQFQRYLGGCNEYAGVASPTSCPAPILGLGYVILQVNYRGSNGYGAAFRFKNFGDLGGGDEQDILTGIDQLVQQKKVDPHKIFIAGWSYGGYLSAWSITQTSRFAGAIDGDGFTDLISYTGTSDDHDFFERYLGSYYWQGSQALYWARSPLAHVSSVTTPLLIFQGQEDTRVPPSQAEELYNALKIQGKDVTLLWAPNQGHEPDDPETLVQEITAITKWLRSQPPHLPNGSTF